MTKYLSSTHSQIRLINLV